MQVSQVNALVQANPASAKIGGQVMIRVGRANFSQGYPSCIPFTTNGAA